MIATVSCLVCDSALEVAPDAEKGEIVECGSCGQEHEVVEAADGRFAVAFAPEVEEDWGE
ncbi:lysine biosynthesis protein LysW [Saccharothrix variisporea]|uniref:Alpha-aminoadipate carrier protein LysW n=1 Tax=Saccharothrix variisporea TaxID=543527 RepID=A0A495XQV3_9PSEU|nr:lysine biosynthesis protein LysW [Saccharothrix variisporea]RKT74823.1 alpha-aminoadipate carrier protein LysW [Saccharothrix variisporea]